MIVVIIIMGVYIVISGSAEANVEMSSDQNEAVIQQSSGVHLFEVNGTNFGSKECNGGWLVFVFILKCTHIAHYCFLTNKLVKKKVAHDVSIQLKDLTKEPLAASQLCIVNT